MALDLLNLLTGFVISGVLAVLIEQKEILTLGGSIAAIVLGTIVYGLGGPAWLAVLMAFFASSSLLTRFFKKEKEQVNKEQFEKGGARDMWQVIANGGLSSLLVAAYFLYPNPIFFVAFLGVLASTNADTWATEIGVLSKEKPRLITSFKPVEKGRSGGVTGLGTFSSFLGAFFIAICALFLTGYFQPSLLSSFNPIKMIVSVMLGGFLGSIFDSLLGATVQVYYFCPECKKNTEQKTHMCGTKTWHKGGLDTIDNDLVNLLASLFGGFASALIYLLI